MIDIHCHPLPGVDDGATDFEVAVEMLKMAADDGITHLVATPHCNYEYPFDPEVNRTKAAQLQKAVGSRIQLYLGCDFHLSYENMKELPAKKEQFAINRSQYILAELGDHFIPDQVDQLFYEIQVAGLVPIVTHPERNAVCRRHPEMIHVWVTRGCLIQVTAQSYLGRFGAEPQRFTEMLLTRNLIHFFASDAHDLRRRPPLLSSCYEKLKQAAGEASADLLMKQNPLAVIEARPLPPNPPALGPAAGKSRRSIFSFLRFARKF